MHLMEYFAVIGSNEQLIYMPHYNDVFDEQNPEAQYYIARIMMNKLDKKKINDKLNLKLISPCAPFQSVLLQKSVVLDIINK